MLTLRSVEVDEATGELPRPVPRGKLLAPPKLRPVAETEMFYRHKQKVVTVRRAIGDRAVAMIQLVSPGNKAARHPLRTFVERAAELLSRDVHLLVVDLHPPGKLDPEGMHAEIWQEIAGQEYPLPRDKPLTLAAYESGTSLRAYVVNLAVGDTLRDMPLFLEPGLAVEVPLEATYNAAFAELPPRWARVLAWEKT